MKDSCKDFLKKGNTIYVIDYWGTFKGTQVIVTKAEIVEINKDTETFIAVLYGDTYQRYSFNDYGYLFFDNPGNAVKESCKYPNPRSEIYQIIGKRIYKKSVEGITGKTVGETYDLFVCLNKGNDVSLKEINKTLFLRKSKAKSKLA